MRFAKDFKTKMTRLVVGLSTLLILSWLLDSWLFSGMGFSPFIRFGVGGVLFTVGVMLPAVSGRHLRLYGRSNHEHLPRGMTDQLVTKGLFKYLRHSAFQGFWFLLFGLGLLLNSPAFVFICAPLASGYVLYFALVIEDAECLERFGDEYEQYLGSVPGFWPGWLFSWTLRSR